MGDEFDDFEMDALIEEDDAMMGGGDADEEEAMFELEEASERAGVDATRATQATQPGGADDEDLDWLANAGATQTQAGADDAAFPDDDELDPADPGVPSSHPAPRTVLEPVALDSNARADAPARLAADIDGDAVPITSSDGRRVFVRAERERPSDAPAPRESFFTSSTASLASAPRAGARRASSPNPSGLCSIASNPSDARRCSPSPSVWRNARSSTRLRFSATWPIATPSPPAPETRPPRGAPPRCGWTRTPPKPSPSSSPPKR